MRYLILIVLILSGCTTLTPNPDFCGARCAVELVEGQRAEIDWYADGGPGTPVFPYQRDRLGGAQPGAK